MHLAACGYCRARLYYLPRPVMPDSLADAESPDAVSAETGAGPDGLLFWHRVLPCSYAATMRQVEKGVQRVAFQLEKERAEAMGLAGELLDRSPEQREILLRNCPRFHTWGLYELLVERSGEALRDPARAEALGHLALRLAEELDTSAYVPELIEDLRARTWGYIANSRRLRSDLRGADDAFTRSYAHLRRGTREPVERATLLDLKASLRRDQRRLDDALRLLQRAVTLFLDAGDSHRAGRSLVNLSTVHSQAGRTEEAVPLLYQALELIDAEQDPRLLLCTRHNLIGFLAEAGRYLEAQSLYRETRQLYHSFPDPWTRNRRNWVKGKISRGLGYLDQAESLFLAARDGFIAEGVPYDTALVSLELATLYAEQGRTAELKKLAGEMIPIFTAHQIHREALAAFLFLQQATEAERLGTEVAARVAAYLRRAQHDPGHRFDEGG
jgi:tetratricopeptide (TPR) repeat protein